MPRVLPPGPRWFTALHRRLHRGLAALRRVIGVPDYDAYVAHLRRAHPGRTPLPREEFLRQRLEDRHARPGARCC